MKNAAELLKLLLPPDAENDEDRLGVLLLRRKILYLTLSGGTSFPNALPTFRRLSRLFITTARALRAKTGVPRARFR